MHLRAPSESPIRSPAQSLGILIRLTVGFHTAVVVFRARGRARPLANLPIADSETRPRACAARSSDVGSPQWLLPARIDNHMLSSLRLRNFRGFRDHSVPLRDTTVVVGRNNAGKSTLVEALRLLSLVTTRFRALGYHEPNWGDIPRREVGVRPSLKGLELNFSTLFHRYGSPPAIVEASFSNKTAIRIYIGGNEQIHAVIVDPDGRPVRSKAAAMRLDLPAVEILPQVAPLEAEESVLNEDYVRRAASSSLAPKHFRNQLKVFKDNFTDFCRVVEDTWPGLRIQELQCQRNLPGEPLTLMVRDEDFVAEVAAMGHGLQMWLQTMWFLARVPRSACVILDEPDVYMHPDLQRRLIRYLRGAHQQVIIATHSIEIMAEADPEDVLVVDRRRALSRFATGAPALQRLVDHVGSVHNVQLARLWNARKCLLVEGNDVKLLGIVHRLLFADRDALEALPHMPVGGWGGWAYAVGSSMLLQNAGGEAIAIYCVLDSDYHSSRAITERLEHAKRVGVHLHIWSLKELENYFLVPSTISRTIDRRVSGRKGPTEPEVGAQLEVICGEMQELVFDAMAAEVWVENRALGAPGANRCLPAGFHRRRIRRARLGSPGEGHRAQGTRVRPPYLGEADELIDLELEVFRTQSRAFRYAREHARADFVAVLKCEYEIGPIRSSERAVRARLSFERPANLQERQEHAPALGRRPVAQAAWKVTLRNSAGASRSSRRSAITRRASACTRATASLRSCP